MPRRRNRRARRSDRGSQMGERQHRRVRRRSGQRHGLRRIRRRDERGRAARGARSARAVPQGDPAIGRRPYRPQVRFLRKGRAPPDRASGRRRGESALSAHGRQPQGAILDAPRDLGGLPFGPTIDGNVLPTRAIEQVRSGAARGIPVLAGTTMEEWKLFTAARPKLRLMDAAKLRRYTAGLVGEEHADALLAAYGEGSPFERWNAVMTDHSFAVPASRLLEAQSAHAPAFAYRFDWRSPLLGV